MREFKNALSRRSFLEVAAVAGCSSALANQVKPNEQQKSSADNIGENLRMVVSKDPLCSMEVGYRITGVIFSPDSKTIATIGLGTGIDWLPGQVEQRRWNRIVLWDAINGKLKHELDGSIDSFCCAFSPNGKTIAAGRDGGIVRIWGTNTGKEIENLVAVNRHRIQSVAFDSTGEFLYVADGRLRKWNIEQRQLIEVGQSTQGPTYFIAYPRTGHVFYTAEPRAIAARDRADKIVKQLERPHSDRIRHVDAAPYGWVATRSGRTAKLWRSSLEEHRSLPVNGGQWNCFHPHLPILVLSGMNTKFYSLPDLAVVGELPTPHATCVAVSPDGELLATATVDMTVSVWRLTSSNDN